MTSSTGSIEGYVRFSSVVGVNRLFSEGYIIFNIYRYKIFLVIVRDRQSK